jgi:hypothetical protein
VLANPLILLVPEARIELARARGPVDFESTASTSFTTPAEYSPIVELLFYATIEFICNYSRSQAEAV